MITEEMWQRLPDEDLTQAVVDRLVADLMRHTLNGEIGIDVFRAEMVENRQLWPHLNWPTLTENS